jgi:hypothetical protein
MTFKRGTGLAIVVLGGLLGVAFFADHRGADSGLAASSKPHGHHGGHVIKVPGDSGIEMELTVDEQRRRLVLYVQESVKHKPHSLPVETVAAKFEADGQVFDARFEPDPRSSDSPGGASRFALSLDELPQQLLASNRFELSLSYSVDGRRIDVGIAHENDHSHDHHHD